MLLKLGISFHPREIPAKCELTILESQDTVALNDLITGRRYKSKDIDLSTKTFVDNVYTEFTKISKISVKNEKSILAK